MTQNKDKKIMEVGDFFSIVENNPPKGSFSYIYYFNKISKQKMNKFIRNERGIRVINPLYDKLYIKLLVKFNYGVTYKEKIERKNPEYQIQKQDIFKKISGYDIIEIKENTLYLPVAEPIIVKSQYYEKLDSGEFIKLPDIYVEDYLPNHRNISEPASGVSYHRYKLDNIYKITVYGHVWFNSNFEHKDALNIINESLIYNNVLCLNESFKSSKLDKASDSMLAKQNKKNPFISTKQDFFKKLFFDDNDKYKTDLIEDKYVIYPIKSIEKYEALKEIHGSRGGCALWRKKATGKLEIKSSNKDLDDNWIFVEGLIIKKNKLTVGNSEKEISKQKVNKAKPDKYSDLHNKISKKSIK